MLQGNPAILNKAGNETNDPALLVGMKFSIEKKKSFVKTNLACQPPESVLCETRRLLRRSLRLPKRKWAQGCKGLAINFRGGGLVQVGYTVYNFLLPLP